MKPIGFQLIDADPLPAEPVSLVMAKKQLKMEGFDDDDAYLALLITAMREKCEEYCHRSFVPQQWQLGFERWPCYGLDHYRAFELTRPPVASVESIRYIANGGDGSFTALDEALFHFDGTVMPGMVNFTRASLPSVSCDYAAPIQVVINCGVWATLPSRVSLALLMFLTAAYENRPSVVTGTIATEIPDGAKTLLDSLKIWKI